MTAEIVPLAPTAAGPAAAPIPARRLVAYLAMVLGLFMAVLDIQIVASSLAEIRAGLSASQDEISWIQTSYLIAEVVVIPLTGFLQRLLSTRILFVLAAGGFTLMSLACAMAWNIETMMLFRALQGLFGGVMIPTVFTANYVMFPPGRQAMGTVMAGLVATIAPTLGPTLGGWITDNVSWHWLFLINVGPGLCVCIAVWRLVDIDRPDLSLLSRIDWTGILLVALFLGTLEFVLEEGPSEDWFDSPLIVKLSLISLLSALAFIWHEWRTPHPVVDLQAFRDRNFTIGCLLSFIVGMGLFGSVYILPLFLASVRGYSAFDIGLVMMATGLFQFLSAPLAGVLEKRMEPRLMAATGFLLFGVGLWLNAFMTAQSGFADLFWPQAVRGIAIMFCFLPMTALALGRLPAHEVGNASGLYNLMRNLGGAIGLALLDTLFEHRFDHHYEMLRQHLDPARPGLSEQVEGLAAILSPRLGDGLQAELGALSLLKALVVRESLVLAWNDLFFALSLVFALALFALPFARRVEPVAAMEAVVAPKLSDGEEPAEGKAFPGSLRVAAE
jgi:DHA2 family multidrug resistance protein